MCVCVCVNVIHLIKIVQHGQLKNKFKKLLRIKVFYYKGAKLWPALYGKSTPGKNTVHLKVTGSWPV